MKIQTCGSPHHLIVADRCLWGMTTFIEDIAVSSVGMYQPHLPESNEIKTIGSDRHFETFVFRTDGDWSKKVAKGERGDGFVDEYNHPNIEDFSEIDSYSYNTTVAANEGHWMVVEKWKQTEFRIENRNR